MAQDDYLVPMLSQNVCCEWGAWWHSEFWCFLSLISSRWRYITYCRRLAGALSLPASDFSVRSFLCLFSPVLSDSLQPLGLQHARLLYPSPTPGAYSNSCQWGHTTISSSVVPFSSHLQSLPASGSFPRSLFFTSDGQSIGVSALASALPMSIQDWFPLGWTGWISLLSKGLSRVFSNTTVQKHQFFSDQLSL